MTRSHRTNEGDGSIGHWPAGTTSWTAQDRDRSGVGPVDVDLAMGPLPLLAASPESVVLSQDDEGSANDPISDVASHGTHIAS